MYTIFGTVLLHLVALFFYSIFCLFVLCIFSCQRYPKASKDSSSRFCLHLIWIHMLLHEGPYFGIAFVQHFSLLLVDAFFDGYRYRNIFLFVCVCV